MNCISCKAALPEGARFCPDCGTGQRLACPACDTTVAANARFCHACGTALRAAAAPTGSPLASAPPAAASGKSTSATAGSAAATSDASQMGQRRHLSVMFCDLVGSVEMARSLDPEDLRDVVRSYREACAAVVADHDGTMAQFHGDGIVVYFGYPLAHEGDARRAVQAGLDIVEAVARLSPSAKARHGVELSVRVAVNSGLTLVGDADATAGIGRLALGDTPNIAARLQGIAQPNTVVISQATQRLVAGFFKMTALGPHDVKGVAKPIDVYSVEGASGARHRLEAASKQRLAPYVGRSSAIAALAKAWLAAQESPGHAVLLTGDPGVGKSRLLSEFRESIATGDCDIVECFCSSYYSNTALYPLVAPLRERLAIAQARSPAAALLALREALVRSGCEIDTALPLLAKLLGLQPASGYQPLNLHPLTQKQKTLMALVTLLTSRANTKPTLMVVEDLHWVDSTTLELLSILLRELPHSRLLVLLTSRPGFSPPWLDSENLTLIPVNLLSPADTETLIHKVVGGKRLPAKLMSLLVDKTDGNPLYVEEMTRMFLDSGSLRETASGYELDGPMPDSLVPESLQDLLMARLDRMPAQAKKVVQLGACIGREWTFELLLAVLPNEEQTLSLGVEQLIGEGIVFATGRGFTIQHALIQDACYESLLKSTRLIYHERIAQALENNAGDTALPERIAQHWTKAGQPARALPYWLEAGQQAVASSATSEAESHLHQGLEAAQSLPEGAERDRMELALLSTLGVALTIQQGWAAPAVAQVYQRAQTLSERVGPTPQLFWVLWGMWAFYLVKGDQHRAVEFARRMTLMAESDGNADLKLEANFALGLSQYYMGQLASAQQLLEAAVAGYVAGKHAGQAHYTGQDVGVTARTVAAMVLFLRGHTRQGLSRSRQAITLASELNHPFSHAYALGCAAWLDAYRQAPLDMGSHAAQTIELSTRQALGFWTVWGSIFAGRALVAEGQGALGARHMEEALANYRSIGSGMVVPYFLALLAEVESGNGDHERALARLAEARQIIEEGGEAFMSAEIERLDGDIRSRLPDCDPVVVEQRYRSALEVAHTQGNRLFAMRAATSLARWLMAHGQGRAATRLLQDAIAAIADGTSTVDLDDAQAVMQELAAAVNPQT